MPNPYPIITNGEKLSAERLQQLAAGRTVIACDGAIDGEGNWTVASNSSPRSDESHHSSSSRAQTRDLKIPDMPSAFRDDNKHET